MLLLYVIDKILRGARGNLKKMKNIGPPCRTFFKMEIIKEFLHLKNYFYDKASIKASL